MNTAHKSSGAESAVWTVLSVVVAITALYVVIRFAMSRLFPSETK